MHTPDNIAVNVDETLVYLKGETKTEQKPNKTRTKQNRRLRQIFLFPKRHVNTDNTSGA